MKIENEDDALAALETEGFALEYVPEPLRTAEVCLAAVKQDGFALECVPEPLLTAEICLAALKQVPGGVQYLPDHLLTAELCQVAVQESAASLEYIPPLKRTAEVCQAAGVSLADVPKIENIHSVVYEAARLPGALNMSSWHSVCGTAHCRAGWVVTLAGMRGAALEEKVGTPAAAALIYQVSDPKMIYDPCWYGRNAAALADMARLARAEKDGLAP